MNIAGFKPWAICGCVLIGASPAVTQADILGVGYWGKVYDIDSATGAGTLLASYQQVYLNDLARSPDGSFWAAGESAQLWSVDPLTGTTAAGPTISGIPGVTSIRGLAFAPGGQLYAINNYGGSGSTSCCDDLYRIDVATGAATLVGSTGFPGIQALAFRGHTLYGWDVGDGSGSGAGLITLDTSSGAGADVNVDIGGTSASIQGLAFSPSGVLYGAHSGLFTVDTTTGAISGIGGSYDDVRGIAFTTAVPEPAPAAILLAGLGCLTFFMRARRNAA